MTTKKTKATKLISVDEFWSPWETEVKSFSQAIELMQDTFNSWSSSGAKFAWRGQIDADWPLRSSLHRRLGWTDPVGTRPPDEARLQKMEKEVLTAAHRWGLHTSNVGRLSALNQLAMFQHYGVPTRLLDITLNPLVGLWFATEETWKNGEKVADDKDGRLFAFDISQRLINEDKVKRNWEDENRRPWPRPAEASFAADWTTKAYAWKPPQTERRIAAQNGAFLLGGVPSSHTGTVPMQWPKNQNKGSPKWTIDEVRQVLSVPVRIHKIAPERGGAHSNPAYTIRISASAKSEIRKKLTDLFGINHSVIYPDVTGFNLHGVPRLRSSPRSP